jgi:hypothetical protein
MSGLRKISLNELREIKEEGVSVVLAGVVINFVSFIIISGDRFALYFWELFDILRTQAEIGRVRSG